VVVSSPPSDALRGSGTSDEYDNCSSATVGCCLRTLVAAWSSALLERRPRLVGVDIAWVFLRPDVGRCTRRVVLECRLLPVGRLSLPSAAKNTDTRALREHR